MHTNVIPAKAGIQHPSAPQNQMPKIGANPEDGITQHRKKKRARSTRPVLVPGLRHRRPTYLEDNPNLARLRYPFDDHRKTRHISGMPRATVKLIELVFPQQTNHYGTLYGGTALALMDKTGFLAASRCARRTLVTASSQRIDFLAPARKGQIVELIGTIERVGTTSITTAVELHAEDLLTGARTLCAHGSFAFVAVDDKEPIKPGTGDDAALPPHGVHMMEMIFPGSTNHHGTLYGGTALDLMGKAAFVTATRFCRQVMVMTAADRTDFHAPAYEGELVDLIAEPVKLSGSDLTVAVTMHAENLLTGARRLCTRGHFTMQARDATGQAVTIDKRI